MDNEKQPRKLFEKLRNNVVLFAELAIRYRYFTVGSAIALLIITISLFPAGFIKFKAFPDLEGNLLETRIIMPQGTPFDRTEAVVAELLASLKTAVKQLPPENKKPINRVMKLTAN